MINFDFTLDNTDAVSQEILAHRDLFQQLEIIGYFQFSHGVLDIMKNHNVQEFFIESMESDYEGGWYMKIQGLKFTQYEADTEKQDNLAFDATSELKHYLNYTEHKILDNIATTLKPTTYLGKMFKADIDSIMAIVCPDKVYQHWCVLQSKAELDKRIAIATPTDKSKKPDFKI